MNKLWHLPFILFAVLIGSAIVTKAIPPAVYSVEADTAFIPLTPLKTHLNAKKQLPRVEITEENVWKAMDIMIGNESGGSRGVVNPRDVDGKKKLCDFQYDTDTWKAFEIKYDFQGDPCNRRDATEMTRRALLGGDIYRWGPTTVIKVAQGL